MPERSSGPARPAKLKVAVPAGLMDKIAKAAEANNRSITREVEGRLRASFDEFGPGHDARWGAAMGRLMTLLAQDCVAGSQSADEALARMKAAAPALTDTLLDPWRKVLGSQEIADEEKAASDFASHMGRALADKVVHAHEPAQRPDEDRSWLFQTQSSLAALQQAEAKQIQEALYLSPSFLEMAAKKAHAGAPDDGGKAAGILSALASDAAPPKAAKPKMGISLADPDAFYTVRVPASERRQFEQFARDSFPTARLEPALTEKGEGQSS